MELFNAEDFYIRDLKQTRTRINNPRLNLTILGHPSVFIRMIAEEKDNFDDGLVQRFLISCPKPSYSSYDEIINTPAPKIALVKILHVICEMHVTPMEFVLNADGSKCFNKLFTKYRKFVEKCDTHDGFLGAMFGKSITMILRLSGVLSALNSAIGFLNFFPKRNVDCLDGEFMDWVKGNLENFVQLNPSLFDVDGETVLQAANLVEYFNIHKMKLAGYNFQSEKIDLGIIADLLEISNKKIINFRLQTIMKKTMEYPSLKVQAIDVYSGSRYGLPDVLSAFEELEALDLGVVEVETAKNHKSVHYFVKCKKLLNDITVSSKLQLFGCSLGKIKGLEKEEDHGMFYFKNLK